MTSDEGSGIASEVPHFDGVIQVSQISSRRLWPMLALGMVGAFPVLFSARWIDDGATGFMAALHAAGALVGIVLSMVGMCLGMVAWFVLEERWNRWRKVDLFSGKTHVRIDAVGLFVEALGTAPWNEVLSLEGVPDSDSNVIVHTAKLRMLLLSVPLDEVLPALHHHMGAHADMTRRIAAAHLSSAQQFHALVFRWPAFLAWIACGYAAGGSIFVAMLIASERGALGTLLGAAVVAFIAAWLVWCIPLARFTTFASQHTRAFQLDGDVLASTDGLTRIDLRGARVRRLHRKGWGYDLEFINIRSQGSPALDLALDGQDLELLTEKLLERSLLYNAESFRRL